MMKTFLGHIISKTRTTTCAGTTSVLRVATARASATFASSSTSFGEKSRGMEVYRQEYKPIEFTVPTVELEFHLGTTTLIKSRATYLRKDPKARGDLVLNGESKPGNMVLQGVKVNGDVLEKGAFELTEQIMRIPGDILHGEKNVVEIDVTVEPKKNTCLSGLFETDGSLFTQCEAEGFRNFMYWVDRPDCLSKYRVKIIGNKSDYPIMLSNGNDIDGGDMPDGKSHFVLYEDPWPKPCYLFAMVAGKFHVDEDYFMTRDGRNVRLRIFVDHGNEDKTRHAMESLKKSFAWDEERFDRLYDLDQFNLVATNSFNMGAMENKSLNVFDSKYVLASPETATDDDFISIESIIGHEYFHNWSGNRVTCRDWFQLTLKEGLTVFRDQEFTSDLNSRVTKRIQDVKLLREIQFPEDASPIAHPIRPDSYQQIDNFYTATVYEKGAEIIRMVQTVVGVDGFKNGLSLYFERHDGQAVTCEDFIRAMEDANPGTDLSQFLTSWYCQSGTPHLQVDSIYDGKKGILTLSFRQSCPSSQPKQPFDIPFAFGLIGEDSKQPIRFGERNQETVVLRIKKWEQKFTFHDIPEKPVLSMLRGYSAPVKLYSTTDLTIEKLAFLAKYDTDEFVRYDSLQQVATQILCDLARANPAEIDTAQFPGKVSLLTCLENNLKDQSGKLDKAVCALSLSLPDENAILEEFPLGTANVEMIARACETVNQAVAVELKDLLLQVYHGNQNPPVEGGEESFGQAMARRALKNAALHALSNHPDTDVFKKIAYDQYLQADNMTDRYAALVALAHHDCKERTRVFELFADKFGKDKVVMTKWLRTQSVSRTQHTLENVQTIASNSPYFDIKRPNDCYALVIGLSRNFELFHKESTVRFIADMVIQIDKVNPSVASRVAKTLTGWRKLADPWRSNIKMQLHHILREQGLSSEVKEIIEKALGDDALAQL